jgi:hypothetical protein
MIILASILLLLVGASVAHAECAWVLWRTQTRNNVVSAPELQLAFTAMEECVKELERKWQTAGHPGESFPRTVLFWPVGVMWHCLPDTIDPRGPKGTK